MNNVSGKEVKIWSRLQKTQTATKSKEILVNISTNLSWMMYRQLNSVEYNQTVLSDKD